MVEEGTRKYGWSVEAEWAVVAALKLAVEFVVTLDQILFIDLGESNRMLRVYRPFKREVNEPKRTITRMIM
jgi:hypothetical protein